MSGRRIKAVPLETKVEQSKASNPDASVWVSANAGSGKTHVLSERVIRLLLSGVNPSGIVCLTYTKAAASLMANRVFERLSAWINLDDEKLGSQIGELDGAMPGPEKLREARRLFASALETPGGLKIQTIHAFCQMILGRFPLEANIAGHFELIDDETAAQFLTESRRQLLQSAHPDISPALSAALTHIIALHGENALETLLESAQKHRQREELARFAQGFREGGHSADDLARFLDIDPEMDGAAIIARAWPLKSTALPDLRLIAAEGPRVKGARARTFSASIAELLQLTDPARRFEGLKGLLTAKGEVSYKKDVISGLQDCMPHIEDVLENLARDIAGINDELARLATFKATVSAFLLIGDALRIYADLKARRSLLDHDDVIERTVKLLIQSDAGAWVQFKLDQGIDHILVDEAQDTSPPQWKVIRALSEEFFAGKSSQQNTRTLFAVGDEKQSIYSFQGARPEVFSETGRVVKQRVDSAKLKFDRARLNLSFRSTGDVLSAVDKVFESPDNRRGLSFDGSYDVHEPIREHGPGRVEVWPRVEATEDEDIPDDWTLGRSIETRPAARLATAIAGTIEDWIKNKRFNEATGREIQPKDIMVLVRKRGPFVAALSRELKNRHVPVSGADRLKLTDHIAVKDLLAIAKFCLMPDDDLSLAALLRSPVFLLTDDELTSLAAGRGPELSLFGRLSERAASNAALAKILAELERWQAEAAQLAAFDFYALLLGRDGIRARLIQRLGIEAGDIVDEFLNFVLASERAGLSGLQEFVETLESAAPEIKREMDPSHDEVRIMTVHGAKGQEAPIVFLVDPPASPVKQQRLIATPLTPPVFVWEPAVEFTSSKTRHIHAQFRESQAQEFRRLLYVGMTRAEDRLIVCGFANKAQAKDGDTWLEMVRSSLATDGANSRFQPHPVLEGEVLIWQSTSGTAPMLEDQVLDAAPSPLVPPSLRQPLPPVRLVPRPLSPSSASLVIEPETAVLDASPVLSVVEGSPSHAAVCGLVTHRLLEVLPGLPAGERPAAARRYVQLSVPDWPEAEREQLLQKVLGVLANEDFSAVFAPGSRAEVSVMGTLKIRGEDRIISGKIDRIAVLDDRVLLIDYKTGSAGADEIPQSYVTQMALYRALIEPLYRGRKVEAALLFTETATLRPLTSQMLGEALEALTDS